MLASDRAAGIDTRTHDLAHRVVDALRFVGVVCVIRDIRMQIAVARMEDVTDLHAIPLADFIDALENFGELGAWHDGILHDEMWRETPHRAECLFPSLPEAGATRLVARD